MKQKLTEFKEKIRQKQLKIAVVGLGYVGLPLAYEFANKGFSVFGIDVDKDRLRLLKKKKSYITDIGSKELGRVIQRGYFKVSGDFKVLKNIDVVFVCVPTPLKKRHHPDISYILSAIKAVADNLKSGSLVVLESTTYPGTTEEVILPILKKHGLNLPRGVYLCFSPERIDPGNKAYPLRKIPKIIGGINSESAGLAKLVYKIIIDKVLCVSSARVAETVKLLENTFRLVNIGLIDEMAMMAHKMGIDIWEVIHGASTKPFGFMPFYPSAGVGGHCIPKDPLYLDWQARRFGFNSQFIKLASKMTTFMPMYIVQRLEGILRDNKNRPNAQKKALKNMRVLVIGVTYKRDVKDLRKSPALDVIDILKNRNIRVNYHDPIIPYLRINHIRLNSIKLTKENLGRFDCVAILTDHSGVNYNFLLKNSRLIFDTRNIYAARKHRKIIKL
ncbi:MAG: nucleotide sugar dehydrogenase [Candidatus Omnitrophota bacterium]